MRLPESSTRRTTPNQVRTRIWSEAPEPDNPFATRSALCHGYDVYGEMLGHARWVEMLYLLLRGERPAAMQAALMEALAVALANAGPRDAAVHAAMCAGVGGSTAASSLMAALAVGAGRNGGAREVHAAVQLWRRCETSLDDWRHALQEEHALWRDVWPLGEHPPGFEAHGAKAATIVCQSLDRLSQLAPDSCLRWLHEHRPALERTAGRPIAMTGVAAATLAALGFDADEAEMLHLLLRLPGAAAHALEQRRQGHKSFPFFGLELQDDAHGGPHGRP